jgi:anti-anti-sigma factor
MTGTRFTASLSFTNGIPRVSLSGEADIAALDRLNATLCAAAAADVAVDICVDVARLTFIDASAIDALVAADAKLRVSGRRLQLVNASRRTMRLLDILDLDGLICSVR